LRSQGADNNLIKGILATEFEKYKKINEIILNSEYVAPGVVVALGKPNQKYDNVATAKAADTLLDMADVQAAFSITNHQNGYISISARSFKDYNVQTIMEAMGGGGHFNAAATQIYERNIDE
ncbi:DHHA1 domain-containing protein, partial [Halomonas borealis]